VPIKNVTDVLRRSVTDVLGSYHPEAPHLTNITDLYTHDFNQSFELTWNAFSSADADDRILIQVWDNTAEEETIFQFLDAGDTSYVFPGGTFEANKNYDIELVFVNETDGLETPETIIGYLSTTSFFLTTYTSDTELVFFKWQRNFQTGPEAVDPGSPAYRPFATVTGQSNSVTYAEVVSDSGPHSLTNTPTNSNIWSLAGPFQSKEDLDTAYPSGDISFYLEENSSFNFYGQYFFPDAAYPAAPQFQNYFELVAFDATEAQLIQWNAPPASVKSVDVFILQGSLPVWSQELQPEANSVELPANTLEQENNFILVVRFRAPITTSEDPPVSLGYMTSTAINFQTSADAGGGSGVEFAYAVKERIFLQEGDTIPQGPFGWSFGSGVVGGNNVTGGSVDYPGGSQNFSGEFGDYGTEGGDFPNQEALNDAYPDGNYTVNVTVDGSSQPLGPFTISGDAYPPAPQILNGGDLRSHDFSLPFTLNWSAFTGYDSDDQIVVEIWNATTDDDIIMEFLPPETTSFEIPGNTFAAENQYEVSILFINETGGLETPNTIIGYLTRTEVLLSTSTSDTELFFFKFERHRQTAPDVLEDTGYLSSASVTGNTNTITFAHLDTDADSFALNNPSQNFWLLNTMWDNKESMDAAYPSGEFHFYLEENGSGISYASNYLPPDAYPTPAVFQNFSELKSFDATEEQMVSWSPAPEGVNQIRVRITAGFQEVLSMDLDPSATSVAIPAGTLTQYSNYTLAIGFWNRLTGSEFPAVSLGYTTTTFMSLQTAPLVPVYADWVMAKFTVPQQNNPGIVGEDADPDGDKLSNYLEFLLGTNPRNSNSGLSYRMEGRTLVVGPIPGGANWELRSGGDFSIWGVVGPEMYEVLGNEIRVDLNAFASPTFIQLVLSDNN
jgi:hypothetical protein